MVSQCDPVSGFLSCEAELDRKGEKNTCAPNISEGPKAATDSVSYV